MWNFVAARRARSAYPSLRSQFMQFWRCVSTEPEGRAMNKKIIVLLVFVSAAGCSSGRQYDGDPPMISSRKVSEQECIRPLKDDGGNLMCRLVTEAEIRARIAEQERQDKAPKEDAKPPPRRGPP